MDVRLRRKPEHITEEHITETDLYTKFDIVDSDLAEYLSPFIKQYTQKKYYKYIEHLEKELKKLEDEFDNLPNKKFIEFVKCDYIYRSNSKKHNEYYENYVRDFLDELEVIRTRLIDHISEVNQQLNIAYDEFLSASLENRYNMNEADACGHYLNHDKIYTKVSEFCVMSDPGSVNINNMKLYYPIGENNGRLFCKGVYYWRDLMLFETFEHVDGNKNIKFIGTIGIICNIIISKIIREYTEK